MSFRPPKSPSAVLDFRGVPLVQWRSETGPDAELVGLDPDRDTHDPWKLAVSPRLSDGMQPVCFLDPSAVDDAWRSWFRTSERFSIASIVERTVLGKREQRRTADRIEEIRTEAPGAVVIEYLPASSRQASLSRAVKHDQIVWARSPVRMDIGGGWTDTHLFGFLHGAETHHIYRTA